MRERGRSSGFFHYILAMDLSKIAIFFCSGDCSNNMYFRGLYLSDIGQVYLALVIIDKTLFGCGLLLIYNTLALHVQ